MTQLLSDFIGDFKYEIVSLVNSFGEFDVSPYKVMTCLKETLFESSVVAL